MACAYDCYQIGGPWIAENPDCPIHGADGLQDDMERIEDMRETIRLLADALDTHINPENVGLIELIARARKL